MLYNDANSPKCDITWIHGTIVKNLTIIDMRRDDFNKLSKELQTEFLDRGGKVEGLNAPSNYMSYTIRWNREQLHGNNKRPMTAKTRKYLNKLKYS